MVEVKTKTDGDKADSGAAAKKTIKNDVVPRLKAVVGGELGNALAEGLLILEERGKATDAEVERLDGSLARLRTNVKSIEGSVESAKTDAAAAKKAAEGAKDEVAGAVETANEAGGKAGEALDKANAAADAANKAAAKAAETVRGVEVIGQHFDEALTRTERRVGDALGIMEERQSEFDTKITSQLEALARAVDRFGTDVDTLKDTARKAVADAEKALAAAAHAEELINTAGELVNEVHARTSEAMDGANARIDDVKDEVARVRTSISPPPPKQDAALPIDEVVRRARGGGQENGRPTPRAGESEDAAEAEILAEMARRREDRASGQEALRLAKAVESDFNGFVAAVGRAFAAVDQKLQILAIAAGASDEEVKAMEDPSLKHGEKR